MPATTFITPTLRYHLWRQDSVVTTAQLAAEGFSRSSVHRRCKSNRWQWLLPGVVATFSGTPTRRQMLIAAHLWAGPDSAIDGADACRWYGLNIGRLKGPVHVVAPADSGLRSTDEVRVRRSTAEIRIGAQGFVPYVDQPTGLIVAARNATSSKDAISTLSRALQTGWTTLGDLRDARDLIGSKWCRQVDLALVAVGVGIRSVAEKDAHDLILTSQVLTVPLWNQWLDLGDGGSPVCVDALWKEAGMVHEVNGKRYHAWAEQFVDMHARHRRLTAAGLVAIGSAPVEIRAHGSATLASIERTFVFNAGRCMPTGVRLIDPPAIAA